MTNNFSLFFTSFFMKCKDMSSLIDLLSEGKTLADA